MDGRRHNVATVQHFFHHCRVNGGGDAAGVFVAGGDLFVHCGKEGAGAAGEIADAQAADGLGAAPVHAVQLGDGQAGQQVGGGGQGVESRQILAVGNQPLEHAAGKVVGVVYAGGVQFADGVFQQLQDPRRILRWQLLQYVAADGENGPIIDFQDFGPGAQGFALGVGDVRPTNQFQRFDALVHSGDALVEHHSVGDDRPGHAMSLRHIVHSQQTGDGGGDARPLGIHFVQLACRPLDAALQGVGGLVHRQLRHGNQAYQIGYVGGGSVQPARFGKAGGSLDLAVGGRGVLRHGKDAVG